MNPHTISSHGNDVAFYGIAFAIIPSYPRVQAHAITSTQGAGQDNSLDTCDDAVTSSFRQFRKFSTSRTRRGAEIMGLGRASESTKVMWHTADDTHVHCVQKTCLFLRRSVPKPQWQCPEGQKGFYGCRLYGCTTTPQGPKLGRQGMAGLASACRPICICNSRLMHARCAKASDAA